MHILSLVKTDSAIGLHGHQNCWQKSTVFLTFRWSRKTEIHVKIIIVTKSLLRNEGNKSKNSPCKKISNNGLEFWQLFTVPDACVNCHENERILISYFIGKFDFS